MIIDSKEYKAATAAAFERHGTTAWLLEAQALREENLRFYKALEIYAKERSWEDYKDGGAFNCLVSWSWEPWTLAQEALKEDASV